MNDLNTSANDSGSLNEPPVERQQDRQPPTSEDDILTAIETGLDSLPPRQTMTLTQALQRLAPAIKRMRAKGYSVDEAAAKLTHGLSGLGMTVSGRTLARLIPAKARAKAQSKAGKTA